ncbi:MAG: glycosyltransferase [Candidatus Altiarchaeota archaeon]
MPVIASVRTGGLAKFLGELGYDVTVITAEHAGEYAGKCRVVRAKSPTTINFPERRGLAKHLEKRLRRVFGRAVKSVIHYPDDKKGWIPYAYEAASRLLEKERFDVMITSGGPSSVYLIGWKIKRTYGLPWIADMRDAWTQNPVYPYLSARKFFEKRLELGILKDADAITATSMILAEKIGGFHRRRVHTIPNGFDPEILSTRAPPRNEKLTFVYTGNVWGGYQYDLSLFFGPLRELMDEGAVDPGSVSVDFFGEVRGGGKDSARKYGLDDIIRMNESVERDVAIGKQRSADVLLQFSWTDGNDRGFIPGKIFEYLAARRPILAVGGFCDDAVTELIGQTNAGVCAYDKDGVKKALKRSYDEFRDRGTVEYHGIQAEIDRYSQVEMAAKFAKIMEKIGR